MSLRECQRVLLRVILKVSSPMILHGAAWRCLALLGAAWLDLSLPDARLSHWLGTVAALPLPCLRPESALSYVVSLAGVGSIHGLTLP